MAPPERLKHFLITPMGPYTFSYGSSNPGLFLSDFGQKAPRQKLPRPLRPSNWTTSPRHQPPGSTRFIVLCWNAATLCWFWHMSSVSTGVLESYSPLRLSISVSYPDFDSSSKPPPSSLHDGGALILHSMCCPASPVFSSHFLKPEDPGCGLGSIVVLCCWLSGEAAPP